MAERLLRGLIDAGFEAYYVGGCVRDMLMGKAPHDIDITTNALPEQIMQVFSGYTVIPTGLKHGTVTVLSDGKPYEITTFRVDGDYSDSRRPDSVTFTTNIIDDLARRDFTMNAIAMDIGGNIIDPYNGVEDIKNHIIRCVGDPEKRFREDALRIMRAIRFASQLGFDIENDTADAVRRQVNSLSAISRERIRDELDKLICGVNCVDVLLNFSSVITAVIPEFAPCIGFDQRSDFHIYDIWEHTVRAMAAAPADDIRLRRSLLFHDIAKPDCCTTDANGKCHFKGHAELSAVKAAEIMRRLRYDRKSITETSILIDFHREKIRKKPESKRIISRIGEELFFKLVELKKCDNSAKRAFSLKENIKLDRAAQEAREYLAAGECCTITQLAIDGKSLMEMGFQGKKIGDILDEILELVIDEKLPNERESMIKYIKKR